MKKIFILLLCVCLFIALCSCESSESEENLSERFVKVYSGYNYHYIYVDRETKVMYLFVKDGYGGGLTVMVDENGKPLLWDSEVSE